MIIEERRAPKPPCPDGPLQEVVLRLTPTEAHDLAILIRFRSIDRFLQTAQESLNRATATEYPNVMSNHMERLIKVLREKLPLGLK